MDSIDIEVIKKEIISKVDKLGEVEIEFTCVYNHDENYMFKKTYTVDTFEELIAYTDKIFKLDTNTIDSISDEMVKTFKSSFDKVLK